MSAPVQRPASNSEARKRAEARAAVSPRHHIVHENFLTRVEIFLANSRGEAFQIAADDYESLICQVDEIKRATEIRNGVDLDAAGSAS